jgi:hypothetical protein
MRTDEKLQELCDRLEVNCGDIHEAARWIGVSPNFVHTWIKDDKVAADRLRESQRIGYGGLESEAIRRAVRGVEKDIYYKGEVVGHEQVYSDGLLGKLLEARVPEYSKKDNMIGTFNGPTQINIMPRAENYEEWLAMRDQTLNRGKALPPPDIKLPEILQGEYVEVPDMSALQGLGL